MAATLALELKKLLGEEHVIDSSDPRYFAYTYGDATMYRSRPDVVVYPGNAAEVAAVIKLARRR